MNPRTSTASETRPLVTFALLAYNQERFIEEAVCAALAQTYGPLEIVLSDDCSQDATFEIIQRLADEYSGPHKIILNRNQVNLGIAGHINKVMEISSGQLVVVAAGDDVSLPNRAEELANLWQKTNYRFDSLCSDMSAIDADGNFLQEQSGRPFSGALLSGIESNFSGLQGASHAWTRRVWNAFGDLLETTVCEDRTIPLRSALLGGVGYCNDPLVRYRIHDSNLSHHHTTPVEKIIDVSAEIHHRNAMISRQHLADLKTGRDAGLCETAQFQKAIRLARQRFRVSVSKAEFLRASTLKKPLYILKMAVWSPAQAARCALIMLFPNRYALQQRRNLGLD